MASAFRNSFKGDKVIWAAIIMLSLLSIVAVFSSTSALAQMKNTSAFTFLLKQVVFVGIGFFVVYIFHNISISLYRRFAVLGLLISIGLMLFMILFGVTLNEGTRWLRVPGIGLTFQPSDIAKVAIIVYLAKTLEEGGLDTYKKVFLKVVAPIGVVCLLIFWGNISTALLLALTCFSIMFVGGIKGKYLLNTLGIALLIVSFVFLIGLKTDFFPRVSTAVNRVMTFVDNDEEVTGDDNFQARQAMIAVSTGSILGKGPGNSTQRFSLPHPYSDFIYAIIIEEYGLFGGILVLMAYLWLLYRAVIISKKCSRLFPVILVLGLMLLIVFQAMINMGVSVGIFPVTGQTLPLVSQGGSSMLFMSVAFGIILAISRTADKQNLQIPAEETMEPAEAATVTGEATKSKKQHDK